MIGKVRKGDHFGGLARYLTEGGRGRVLALDNLASDGVAAAASEMSIAAATSRRTQKPVLHLSLSYAEGEQVTPDRMRADARRVLKALGLKGHQAVILAHDDTDHAHVHVMANRVAADGRAASDSQSYARVESTLREIEGERGWTPVLGRHVPSPVTGQRMKGPRKSRDPRQHRVPDKVRQSLLNAESWAELHQGVRSVGWRFEVIEKGRGSGALLVGPDGQRVAAGQVDRSTTLTALRRRLGRDPETRQKGLAALAQKRPQRTRRGGKIAPEFLLASAFRPFLAGGLRTTLRPQRTQGRFSCLPGL